MKIDIIRILLGLLGSMLAVAIPSIIFSLLFFFHYTQFKFLIGVGVLIGGLFLFLLLLKAGYKMGTDVYEEIKFQKEKKKNCEYLIFGKTK